MLGERAVVLYALRSRLIAHMGPFDGRVSAIFRDDLQGLFYE